MTSLLEKFVNRYGRLPTERDPDYLEMLNMSKYAILDAPTHKPGKCANCGAVRNDGRKYVDFKLEIDWYGIVYLCGICLKDIAKAVGLFDDFIKELEEAKAQNTSLEELKEKGAELHETIVRTFAEVKDFYVDVHSVGDDIPANPDSSSGDSQNSESGSGTDSSESGTSETKSRTSKSTSSSRRTNVPSLAELLESNKQ
jgi:hypothetical protein